MPPADFDPDSYIDPTEYDLDPTVWAENPEEFASASTKDSAFKKAKLVGGIKKLQLSVDYPRKALKNFIQGTVKAKIFIDENGKLQYLKILSSPHETLSNSATAAILESEFKAARLYGESVKSTLVVRVFYQISSRQMMVRY